MKPLKDGIRWHRCLPDKQCVDVKQKKIVPEILSYRLVGQFGLPWFSSSKTYRRSMTTCFSFPANDRSTAKSPNGTDLSAKIEKLRKESVWNLSPCNPLKSASDDRFKRLFRHSRLLRHLRSNALRRRACTNPKRSQNLKGHPTLLTWPIEGERGLHS